METLYREKTYRAGDMLFVSVYPIFGSQSGRGNAGRSVRTKATSGAQARLNERNAILRLSVLIHANYTEKDKAVELTYRNDDLPGDRAAFEEDWRKFIRALRQAYRLEGLELKYIGVPVYGGMEYGAGRPHIHMIINGGLPDGRITSLWGKGLTRISRLRFGKDGVVPLARYLGSQFEEQHTGVGDIREKNARRWRSSQNLTFPEPEIRDVPENESKMLKAGFDPYELYAGRNKGY